MSVKFNFALLAVAAVLFAQPAFSQGHENVLGRKGDPKKVSRTIELDMSDAMRFAPAELVVKQGETVLFPGHFEAGMVGRVRVLAISDKM